MASARTAAVTLACGAAILATSACSSGEGAASSGRANPTGSTTLAPASAPAPELAPSEYEPTPCAIGAAPSVDATATLSRRADGKTDLVMELAPPRDAFSYDANGAPRVFGAGRGAPAVKHDGAAMELRTEITFSSNPYVTFIVPIRCGDQRGAVSASASWESAGTEPGKQLTVEITPFH
jgi:hypothetical protein